MNKLSGKILIVLLFFQIIPGFVYASFENNYFSPRINSMGSAFVAIADDYYTSLVNPAGLTSLDKIGLAIAYTMPFAGFDNQFKLNNYFTSLVYPVRQRHLGVFNFYFSSFSASSLYLENTFSFDYGLSLNTFWKNLPCKISAGAGLKLFRTSFILDDRTSNDPVFQNGRSKMNLGMDLGFLLSPGRDSSQNNYKIGLSVLNLNQPDMGLAGSDPVYRKIMLGFSYSLVDVKLLKGSMVTPSLEIDYSNNELLVPLGVEVLLFQKMLGIQAGWNSHEISAGLSFNYRFANWAEVNFNYSFNLASQVVENYGTHGIALSFKFLNLKI